MRFTLFDRWDNQIGVVGDIVSAIHKDELNGEDSLTLTLASCDLVKGNRIVWRDKFGVWHEHIVSDLKDVHEDGKLYTIAYCESSLAELFTDYIEELRPYDVSATVALQRALTVTRWQIGSVTVQGTASASFYHISAREALSLITGNWGGELSAAIEVSGTHVTSRSVNVTSRGSDGGKRFEWSKDIQGIHRDVASDDVCTALYGYGKGLEAYDEDGQPTGGYERKLTFGDINGGLDYVADEDAKLVWGLPDGNGGIKHAFGKVEFPDCESMEELLALTSAELQRRKQPKVSYTASVIDLADAGYQFEDVRTGDTVALIDRELGERLQGRVLCVERDLFNESATVITLGNIVRTIHDVIADQLSELGRLRDHAAAWDGAASISDSYINGIIRIWNTTMNATGGYVYQEPGEGITVYDKPEDESPTMAIQLKGAGFRIANSKTSGGDWDWRTFGTGDGFTADCLNVGTIRGGSNFWNLETGDLLFEKGRIASYDNSSYWNLTTGAVSLSSSATIGGQSVSGVLTDISQLRSDLDFTAEMFSVDMEALTTRVGTNETDIAGLKLTAQQFSVDLASTNTTITQMQATYGTCSTAAATAAKAVTCADFSLRKGATVTVKFTNKNTAASPTLNVNNSGAKPIYLNGAALPESSYWGAGETMSFIYDGTNWAVMDGAAEAQITVNSSDIASLKLTAQQFSVDLQSVNTAIQTTNQNLATTDTNVANLTLRADAFDVSIKGLQATYATCSTAAATQTKEVTLANFTKFTGQTVVVRFTYANGIASPKLTVQNSDGSVAATGYIYVNGSIMSEYYWWKAGETLTLVWDGSNWRVGDGGTMSRIKVLEDSITLSVTGSLGGTASIKLSVGGDEQEKTIDLSKVREAFRDDNTAITVSAGTVTFNSNTFVVNSTNFSVTNTGVMTATGANITGTLHIEFAASGLGTNSKIVVEAGTFSDTVSTWYGNVTGTKYGLKVGSSNTTSSQDNSIFIIPNKATTVNTAAALIASRTRMVIAADTSNGYGAYLGLIKGSTRLGGGAGSSAWSALTLTGSQAEVYCWNGSSGNTGLRVQYSGTTVTVQGSFYVSGTKSRLAETESHGRRLFYSYETAAPYFGDIGSGITDEQGVCYVSIDDVLTEAGRTDAGYQVFLQRCGAGDLYVAEKHLTYFVVIGTPLTPFDWEVKAAQTGYENTRTESIDVLEAEGTDELWVALNGLYDSEDGYADSLEDYLLEEAS